MQNIIDFRVTSEQRDELEHALVHDTHTEVRVRCQALLRLADGKRVIEVAAVSDVTPHTVYAWHKRFQGGGIPALANKPRSGRPRKWTQEYLDKLAEVSGTDPKLLGYDFTLWTLERLAAHLAVVTNIELTPRSLNDLMEREGYRYRRPKYGVRHLQDPQAVEQARANLEELKKAPSDPTIPTVNKSFSLWTKQP